MYAKKYAKICQKKLKTSLKIHFSAFSETTRWKLGKFTSYRDIYSR